MALYVWVVAGFGLSIVAWAGFSYASGVNETVVSARQNCERAWSNVEVLLQRRHDEVGNLLELADEQREQEQDVLAELVAARERAIEAATPSERAAAAVAIEDSIAEFYAIADEHPDLEYGDRLDDVRDSLTDIEQRLENRREYYNDAVARYNALFDSIPEGYVAKRRGFERREPFEASERAKGGFSVGDHLSETR